MSLNKYIATIRPVDMPDVRIDKPVIAASFDSALRIGKELASFPWVSIENEVQTPMPMMLVGIRLAD